MKKIDKLTKEEAEQAFEESKSWATVAEKLGYSKIGGSTNHVLQDYAKAHNINTSHFTGQGQNKGNVDLSRFKNGRRIRDLKSALLSIKPYKCECCGNFEQMGKQIPLQVHHIDGNHINNELDNLQLLCPNCHAQTDNWCKNNIGKYKAVSDKDFLDALKTTSTINAALEKVGIYYSAKVWYDKARQLMIENNVTQIPREKVIREKKERKRRKIKYCSICGKEMSPRAKGCLCKNCLKGNPYSKRIDFPDKEQLRVDTASMSFQDVGRKYGVSGNAIRKWCKYYDLPYRKLDMNSKEEN